MFMLLHWYCHKGFGYGKIIFTLKIFNIFDDVYTHHGTISLCHLDASARIIVSHNYSTQVFGSILFTPSLVTKWHDRHRYLSIHYVPYLMSLSSPWHCSKTLSLRMDKQFHPTLYNECNYISTVGLKLIHVSKLGPRRTDIPALTSEPGKKSLQGPPRNEKMKFVHLWMKRTCQYNTMHTTICIKAENLFEILVHIYWLSQGTVYDISWTAIQITLKKNKQIKYTCSQFNLV